VQQFNDFTSPLYNVVYFFLVVIFTYVYTALVVNPGQYTEYLRRQNAFIPGIRGGTETEEYIDSITSRITLPGSIILGLIAILPAIVARFGVNQAFAIFFGGTSLIIMVGVVLDTLQQIESYLLMRKYDGLVKKVKSRAATAVAGCSRLVLTSNGLRQPYCKRRAPRWEFAFSISSA
jgi:preprotein translocase subunit SecY